MACTKGTVFGIRETLVQIPALFLLAIVTWGKFPKLSELSVLSCKMKLVCILKDTCVKIKWDLTYISAQ